MEFRVCFGPLMSYHWNEHPKSAMPYGLLDGHFLVPFTSLLYN